MRLTIFRLLICLLSYQGLLAQNVQFKALLVTTTRGWHHESVHKGVLALQQLGVRNNFDVSLLQDPEGFTDKNLKQYKVVIFLNTTGDILDSAQQKVMERFIQAGNGFVGIHSAADTEYDWGWYGQLVGRMFLIHPVIQTATVRLTAEEFPGLQGFSGNRIWTDEWYEFGPEKTPGLTYVLTVDEKTYNPAVEWKNRNRRGVGMGEFHPVAWYHLFDGGRAFYTALGHLPAIYDDTDYLNHLYAAIFWAATGKK
jgi:uncharacterized protein